MMDMHPWPLTRFWRLKISGTIHAGAHKGEEGPVYKKYSFGPVVWIEAIPELAQQLKMQISYPDIVVNATLWSEAGKNLSLKISSSTGSSSVFDFADHIVEHPEVYKEREIPVVTTTIDKLELDKKHNLIVLDLQGAEYEALQGAVDTLAHIAYVICEVNRKELYKGIHLVCDIDDLLNGFGFVRVATRWTRYGWGEALFIKSGLLGTGALSSLRLEARKMVFSFWLKLFEIPIVYLRSKVRQEG